MTRGVPSKPGRKRHSQGLPRPTDDHSRLLGELASHRRGGQELLILLDYDGTLVPFSDLPWLASPDAELNQLLAELCRHPHTHVHLVSGRSREWLEQWFGDLGASLHAEHGFWSRRDSTSGWTAAAELSTDWKAAIRPLFETFCSQTPGAFVEEKTASLAWHYRMADPGLGVRQAHELHEHLTHAFSHLPVEVLLGSKVIEVRISGIHKGVIAARALADAGSGASVLAIGDDRTDEDVFRALSEDALTVHVGPGASRARYRLPDVSAVRAFLKAILRLRSAVGSDLEAKP